MTKNERKFVSFVKNEWQPLISIQKKMNIDYELAYKYAKYLDENKVIRLGTTEINVGHIYIVSLPIETDKSYFWIWIERTGTVLGLIVAVLGLLNWKIILSWIKMLIS